MRMGSEPADSERVEIVPVSREEAREFVRRYHRHLPPPVSHKFSIAAARVGVIVGVVMVGRPSARGLDDGWVLEVTRLCVQEGELGVCSQLYGAAWRAARALGYRRLVTYTLASEPGTSVKAAGFRLVAEVRGRSWHCRARPRVDRQPLQDKLRWELGESGEGDAARSEAGV